MSLNDLAPANTKRARESAARSFLTFLKDENVSWEYLEECMKRDSAAQILEAVVDKFGLYLAFKEGRKGQLLARHSVMQYYRQAKNWLLDQFPQYRAMVDKNLLKKGQVLERHCVKRESGTFVNKAPACTKKALKQMTKYLYSNAVTAADYQDAALLCLLWYLFGRASDLTLLRKANLSIGSGDIFFVRFIRVKTSEEQGLSLFPDSDFTTCPLLAIALALATHSSPTPSLLNQLPEQQSTSQASLTPSTPLIDLIDHPEASTMHAGPAKSTDAASGIHSYVNRVLHRVVGKAAVTENLTSHSFRRGGAQHANGAGMCVQWIFDRGAWNMTSTNKAFAYVFNTPAEDHKVARVLSGRHPDKHEALLSLDRFDSDTQVKIRGFASSFFGASTGLDVAAYNINSRVVDTLIAYVLLHYPSLKGINPEGLAIRRIESCAIGKGVTINELLAWSSHLSCKTSKGTNSAGTESQATTSDISEHPMFRQQAALIEQLILVNQKLVTRLSVMEAKICNKRERTPQTPDTSKDTEDNIQTPKRRRTSAATSLKDAWFSWYAQEPRMWHSTDATTKHTRSNSKMIVAFLKIFIPGGFTLDEKSPRYLDDVLEIGTKAENELLSFLRSRKITARGAQNVLKSMRKLHKSGDLDERICRYKQLLADGRIVDPAPAHTNNIIKLGTAP